MAVRPTNGVRMKTCRISSDKKFNWNFNYFLEHYCLFLDKNIDSLNFLFQLKEFD